ncbi:MAG: hypothetical protein ACRC4S_03875, partial [Cetobacterium sp.]
GGPYHKQLSECPIKDCIHTFPKEFKTLGSKDIINNSPQTTTNDKIDIKLLIPVYELIIPEIKNTTFFMKDNKSILTQIQHVNGRLKKMFKKKKSEPELNLHHILSDLYKIENSDKTFDDFITHGLDKFNESEKQIKDLLNEKEDIYKEIKTYLKNDFFPWWNKNVEDAFSKILKNKTNWFLQEHAVCLFLRDIPETEPFFNIGYVISGEFDYLV